MDAKSLEARLKALEEAVFGKSQEAPSRPALFSSSYGVEYTPPPLPGKSGEAIKNSADVAAELKEWIGAQMPEDTYLVLAAVGSLDGEAIDAFQLSGLASLQGEDLDEQVASLCSALSSRQRVAILRLLSHAPQTSGELATATGMAGGHLHHHIRELTGLKLVYKDDEGMYRISQKGVWAYMMSTALYRYLYMLARHR